MAFHASFPANASRGRAWLTEQESSRRDQSRPAVARVRSRAGRTEHTFPGYPRLRMACRQTGTCCPAGNMRTEREVPGSFNRSVERSGEGAKRLVREADQWKGSGGRRGACPRSGPVEGVWGKARSLSAKRTSGRGLGEGAERLVREADQWKGSGGTGRFPQQGPEAGGSTSAFSRCPGKGLLVGCGRRSIAMLRFRLRLADNLELDSLWRFRLVFSKRRRDRSLALGR